MDTTRGKNQLRNTMREQRKRLSALQLRKAGLDLARQSRQSSRLYIARRILSYVPFAGEISPSEVLTNLALNSVYLPRITNYRSCRMQFFPADRLGPTNKYGIVEPAPIGSAWSVNAFDVILIPMVAFDRAGNRIGMGAGYYDRALAALKHQNSTKPFLIGLAHYFQEVNSLQPAPWDVPLDAILTDREFIQI